MRRSALRLPLLVLAFGLAPFALESCRGGPEPEAGPEPQAGTTHALPEPTVVPGIPPVEVGILWPDADLEQHSPADPLVLRFSEPISAQSDAPALTLFPAIEGSLAWNAAGDGLTFTPTAGFTPGQAYSAYLHTGLRGPRGQGLESERLDFSVLSAPKVLSHSPGASQITDRRPVIQVYFDRPMRAESVAGALSVSPEVEFDLSWDDSGQTLQLNPRTPLPIGMRYRFAVGAAATDARGVPLGEDYHWAYWLEDLEIQVRRLQPGNLAGEIELEFNYPIERESLEQALRLVPSVPLDLRMPGLSLARLTPQQPLLPSTAYEFRFTAPLRDLEGNAYPEIGPQEFVSPPPILSYLPDALDVPVDVRAVQVTFDRPMDQDSVERAFSLAPNVPGQFSWQQNTLTYRLEELLDYGAVYTATIGREARDEQDRPVFQVPFSWSFSHSYFEYLATFGQWGAKVQVVDAAGRRSLEYAVPNGAPEQLTFELHKLSSQQFAALARLDSGFTDPRLADVPGEAEMVYRWEVYAGATREGGLEQMLIPEEVPVGLYLLRMRSEGRVADEIAIALSRYAMAVKRAGRQLLVWASEINGEIVPEMEIRVFATDGRLVREGLTDKNGLYEATLEPGDEPVLVLGRTAEGGSTVAGLAGAWREYSSIESPWRSSRQGISREFLAYLYTDRPIYRPGQTVYFKAIVREDHDAQYRLLPAGSEVPLRILDARDNLVETHVLTLNEFGAANGQFTLGQGAGLGEYALVADLNGET